VTGFDHSKDLLQSWPVEILSRLAWVRNNSHRAEIMYQRVGSPSARRYGPGLLIRRIRLNKCFGEFKTRLPLSFMTLNNAARNYI
jgi:hypothetical protein